MFRYVTLDNGRRVLEVHGGGDPNDPRTWLRAEIDAEGQPYVYRTDAGDITVGVTHGGSVLLGIAGVRFSLDDAQAEQLAALLELAIPDARARRAEFAEEVARARPALAP